MESKVRAEATLASALAMQPKRGTTGENKANYLVAKNVLNEEMGGYGEYTVEYQLGQKTRDVLLVHGRQDAAHALCNTTSLLEHGAKAFYQLRMLNFLGLTTVCLLGAIVFKLYARL